MTEPDKESSTEIRVRCLFDYKKNTPKELVRFVQISFFFFILLFFLYNFFFLCFIVFQIVYIMFILIFLMLNDSIY